MDHLQEKKVSIILSTFNEEIAIEKTIYEIKKNIKNVFRFLGIKSNPTFEDPKK